MGGKGTIEGFGQQPDPVAESQCRGGLRIPRMELRWGNSIGVLHPGAIGQGSVATDNTSQCPKSVAGSVPPGLIPLPTQALDRLGSRKYPTHPDFLRRKVGQDDPGLLLFHVPDRKQGAAALCGGGLKAVPRPIHAVWKARAGNRPRRRR